jgi:hypothetical protein
VVTFGGAKAGTPLIQAHQTLRLDLPLRALVYEAPKARSVSLRGPDRQFADERMQAGPVDAVLNKPQRSSDQRANRRSTILAVASAGDLHERIFSRRGPTRVGQSVVEQTLSA